MKHALTATIELSLPTKADEKADEAASAVKAKIAGKSLWQGQENRVARVLTDEGNPAVSVEMRFDKLADRDDLVKYLKSLDNNPNIKVIGTTHDCYHDEYSRTCQNWKDI